MKVLEQLIRVGQAAWKEENGIIRVEATLAANRDCEVYRGHFPGYPVTPGVLMLGAVAEILSRATGHTLEIARVGNVKYLSMMSPDDIDGCTLQATLSPDGNAVASYTKGSTTYAKIKLTLTQNS